MADSVTGRSLSYHNMANSDVDLDGQAQKAADEIIFVVRLGSISPSQRLPVSMGCIKIKFIDD